MAFHLYDGDNWSVHPDLETAAAEAHKAIEVAREVARFDGEWPEWLESVRVYEGPADTEEPAALPCVVKAVEANARHPSSELDEEGFDDSGDWWSAHDAYTCDFAMALIASQSS